MEGGGWTLETHRAYADLRFELAEEKRRADREIAELKIAHLRELAARQEEKNDIYFAEIAKTVTLESYTPFKEYVTDYISAEKGQSVGVSSTMTWVVGVASAIAGAIVALLTRGGL